jgi:hypothetical protein
VYIYFIFDDVMTIVIVLIVVVKITKISKGLRNNLLHGYTNHNWRFCQ